MIHFRVGRHTLLCVKHLGCSVSIERGLTAPFLTKRVVLIEPVCNMSPHPTRAPPYRTVASKTPGLPHEDRAETGGGDTCEGYARAGQSGTKTPMKNSLVNSRGTEAVAVALLG